MAIDNQLAASAAKPASQGGGAAPEEETAQMTSLEVADKKAAREPLTAADQGQADLLIRWADTSQTKNIADELDEGTLSAIGMRVTEEYEIDKQSRKDWMERAEAAIKLAAQVTEPKTTPWEGSSNVCFPLIGMASIQFSARAYPAIIAGNDVVKGISFGDDLGIAQIDNVTGLPVMSNGTQVWKVPPGDKRRRADRIGQHMSYQLTEEQPEWAEETDKLLTVLPIVGCEFRKTYFESDFQRNCSVRVAAQHLIINYRAKSLETAPRITEELRLYPVEIEENIRSGIFLPNEYFDTSTNQDRDEPLLFLEQHRRLDLDKDGYPEPYICIVHKESMKVARIVARFEPDGVHYSAKTHRVMKIDPVHYYTKFDFLRNPDGGIYGVGFGHYLGHMNLAINASLNQMFDAGTLQNTGGGWVGKGLSMQAGVLKFKIGEWKQVNALGSSVRDAIVPLVHQGPSPVLFQLLGLLIQAGEKMASVNEVLTGQQSMANVPATTTLALIEQGLKVFTAVYKRVHASLGSEYKKLYRLNGIYLDQDASFRRGSEWQQISRKDYLEGAGVAPISDPSMVSDMQMLARAEFLKQFLNDPYVNRKEILTRMFTAARIADIDRLLDLDPQTDPLLAIKLAELRLKKIQIKGEAIKDMAQGIFYLARSDALMANTYMGWIKSQYEMMQQEVESIGNDDPTAGKQNPYTGDQSAAPGGAGGVGGGLPAMAPAPGH